MQDPAIASCPSCKAPVAPSENPSEGRALTLAPCPGCGKAIAVLVFPASGRRAGGDAGAVAGDGDAVCFHHPAKRAEIACDACGRFLCGLCRVELDGRAVCAACFTQAHTHTRKTRLKGNATSANVSQCMRHDKIALACVVTAPFLYFLSFVNAGIALYLCIRHWRTPISVIPRNRWRFAVAGIGASVILALWVVLIVTFVGGIRKYQAMKAEKDARQEKAEEVTDDGE